MADITQKPPKDNSTPGQNIESRKTGDKKVVEELQEFNKQQKVAAKDNWKGFRAIADGIKAGNAEMNPGVASDKVQVAGFDTLSANQRNVIKIFGDMKSSATRSQASMAKDLSVDKGNKLETAREQFNLWERMLLRLVGIYDFLEAMALKMNEKPKGGLPLGGWLLFFLSSAILAIIPGLIVGFIIGLGELFILIARLMKIGIVKFFKGGKTAGFMARIWRAITGFFGNIAVGIRVFGKNIVLRFKNFFKPFTTAVEGLTRNFRAGFKGLGTVRQSSGRMANTMKTVGGQLGKYFQSLAKPFNALILFFKGQGKTMNSIRAFVRSISGGKGMFSMLFKILGLLNRIFNPIIAGIKAGFMFGVKIGRLLGKFSPWIIAIMAIIDGVRGAIDGFKNTEGGIIMKLLGGFVGAVKGIILGAIMLPLDMLKNAVAWIFDKFGWDKMSEGLKSFSFQEIFSSLIDAVWSVITAIVDWVKLLFSDPMQAIRNLASGYMNMVKKLYAWILRKILPTPDANAPWYDIPALIGKVIPDSVYEFAGLNPVTGELLKEDDVEKILGPTPNSKSTVGELLNPTLSRQTEEEKDEALRLSTENTKRLQEELGLLMGGMTIADLKSYRQEQININMGLDTGAMLRTPLVLVNPKE